MGAAEMVRQWRCGLEELLPGLHGHLVNALAVFSVAMALAGHCHGGRLAAVAPSPGGARVASRQRRWERLLGNRRLRPARAMGMLARAVVPRLGGGRRRRRHVVLILDETPGGVGGRLRCMKLSAAYRKRAVPLAFECYPPDDPPVPMPRLLWRLLRRAARSLPAGGAEVTLLADRGLAWPTVLDCCALLGWRYVLRLQRDTRVRLADGTERPVRELARRRGARWFGAGVEVFKKAGWRRANVVAAWEPGCRERWLLVTDRPATFVRCRNYCRRSWCEQLHRDEKSHGFNWQLSRVRDPAHAARLVLVMALATLLCLSLGTHLVKRGLRRLLEPPRRRRLLSVFQLGLRWLRDCLVHDRSCPCDLYLYPS